MAIFQVPSWPTLQANYAFMSAGWWASPNTARYYSAQYGPRYASGNDRDAFEGFNTYYSQAATTNERTFAVSLENGGAHLAWFANAQTKNPTDLTVNKNILNGGTTGGGNIAAARLLLPSNAYVGAAFVGRSSGSPAPQFTVNRLTVLGFPIDKA
jgi:hypothetical protein